MFSHICVGIDDFGRAHAFYGVLATALGLVPTCYEPDAKWAAWAAAGTDRPMLVIGLPFDRHPAAPGNGNMVALLATDRATVDRCHRQAIAAGGRDEGPPGLRPHYHPHYYGAYFRDPDGNKLCVVCHEPERRSALDAA